MTREKFVEWMRTWRADLNMVGDFARDYFDSGCCEKVELTELRHHLEEEHRADNSVLSICEAVHILARAHAWSTDKPVVLDLGVEVTGNLWDLAGERRDDQTELVSRLIREEYARTDWSA